MNDYEHTYEVTHPQLSEPLLLDSHVERTDSSVIAWAAMCILRTFDEMLDRDGFTVRKVTP